MPLRVLFRGYQRPGLAASRLVRGGVHHRHRKSALVDDDSQAHVLLVALRAGLDCVVEQVHEQAAEVNFLVGQLGRHRDARANLHAGRAGLGNLYVHDVVNEIVSAGHHGERWVGAQRHLPKELLGSGVVFLLEQHADVGILVLYLVPKAPQTLPALAVGNERLVAPLHEVALRLDALLLPQLARKAEDGPVHHELRELPVEAGEEALECARRVVYEAEIRAEVEDGSLGEARGADDEHGYDKGERDVVLVERVVALQHDEDRAQQEHVRKRGDGRELNPALKLRIEHVGNG